ncbi:uncharacterized protein EV154DRAFT_547571 [Mucor mucedo]|uniref:uncharacterized protein n=1 Tax=Mucor mucedo TaxID=29922 RepID=UPI00221F4980|nr:uncharacterized protein EV154DRAFT_547571 [Mucor mucedo]KAI7896239.1 hypothetical protein EV154DRAFT_547571 [Mucor mucedo]
MYSPKRTERNDTSHNALTPIVHVLKSAQSTATKEFDRFYDNLWSRLTPSNSRTKKVIQEERTSLTPLIERHTLREDARYGDSFYLDNESIVAETPMLERTETPMSYDSPHRRSQHHYSSQTLASPQTVASPQHRSTIDSPHIYSPLRPMASPRRSTLHQGSSVMIQRLTEERKRMDRLQASVTKIKRQSSYLAEEPHTSIRHEKEAHTSVRQEREPRHIRQEKEPHHIRHEKEKETPTPIRQEKPTTMDLSKHHSSRLSSHQLATPPQSIESIKTSWNKRQRSPSVDHSVKRMAVSPTPTKRMAASPSASFTPYRREDVTPTLSRKRLAVSPKRIPIENLPKLRSTEMISTPGGSIVSNRFWKEIHGLNASPRRREMTPKRETNTSSWANDDGFWSAESAPMPGSTFNNKLMQVAQQEKKQKRQREEQVANDMQWSHEAPVTSKLDMFGDSSPLSQEIEAAQKREAILKRNHIPAMNPDLLAQLKSVHRDRLIDDSDSYKFA